MTLLFSLSLRSIYSQLHLYYYYSPQLVMLCCPIMLILFVITPVISLRSPNQLLQAEQLTPLFGDKTITGFR